MIEVFNQLKSEIHNITRDHIFAISPHHTEHLGQLRTFEPDLIKQVKPMIFELLVPVLIPWRLVLIWRSSMSQ
jgi:hypothetical protein